MTGPVLEPLLNHTATCRVDGHVTDTSVTDGAFVRRSDVNTLNQGARASLTGQCRVRGCSGPNCVTFFTQDRNIGWVPLSYYDPNGTPPAANFMLTFTPPAAKQSIDSSIPGTTNGPVGRCVDTEGTWRFRFWVISTATSCNIQPTTHPKTELEVNTMTCRPEWWVDPIDVVNHHPPDGPITISVPLGYEQALIPLQAATQAWESRLARTIQVVPNYTCPLDDGRCVRVDQTYTGDGCAELVPGYWDSSTGEWISPPTINLTATWRNAHPDHLKHRFSHELGHYLGLWEREHSSCSCEDTAMGTALSYCDDPNPPTGSCTLLPSASDASALQQSTYGKGNRRICGW